MVILAPHSTRTFVLQVVATNVERRVAPSALLVERETSLQRLLLDRAHDLPRGAVYPVVVVQKVPHEPLVVIVRRWVGEVDEFVKVTQQSMVPFEGVEVQHVGTCKLFCVEDDLAMLE